MKTFTIEREISSVGAYDTVVCGAGPAGWIAAVSAARKGAKTALIERLGFAGGCATASYVVPVSGCFNKEKRVVSDIPWEFFGRMAEKGAALVEYPKGNISVNTEYYKTESELMLEEAGVDFYTNAFVSDIVKNETGRIAAVIFSDKSGTHAIEGKIFIDATGDGDVCALAGVPMQPAAGELQPISLCFVIAGADTSTELLRDCIHHDGAHGASVNKVIRNYLLSIENPPFSNFGGPWFNVMLDGTLAVNCTRAGIDATDAVAFAAAERQLRRDMHAIIGLLKEHFPEFRDVRIIASGVNAGVRETRRIVGKYTLCEADIASGAVSDCPVAVCVHPVDIHSAKDAAQVCKRISAAADVPYDCLVNENFGNLICAGRAVSCDRVAMATLRVQATVMSIGEAAGAAAAFALKKGIPVHAICPAYTEEFNSFRK